MKAILIKPRLNEAFKVVQPLPVLTSPPPFDLQYTAAPRFDVTWRATEPTRNSAHALALDAAGKGPGERGRRLSTLAGVVQSCAAMTNLPSHGAGPHALEARLIA